MTPDKSVESQKAREQARRFVKRLRSTFEAKAYQTTAVVTSVQVDGAQRVSGAFATIDGQAGQAIVIDYGAPISVGDVFQVQNRGTPTSTQWVATRRLRSVTAVPPVGTGATLPTPTGLDVDTGIVIGGEGPTAWIYGSCLTIDDSFGGCVYRFQLRVNDPATTPVEVTVQDVMKTTALAAPVDDDDSSIPHSENSPTFASYGRIKVESEKIDYTGFTFDDTQVGPEEGTGVGGVGTFTDASKTWATNRWAGFVLVTYGIPAGTEIHPILSNTATILTVAGTTVSGDYAIFGAFTGCTRGAGGTTPASHVVNKTIIRRSMGTNLGTFPANTDYNVRVRAERPSDGGLSAWTAWATVTTDVDTIPPEDPEDLGIEDVTGGVALSWTAPTLYGCPDLAGFELYRGTDSSGTGAALVQVIPPVLATTYPMPVGDSGYFNLKAVDVYENRSGYAEATWLLGTALPGVGAQILTNSDFERDTDADGVPDDWVIECGAGSTVALATGGYDGGHCVKLSAIDEEGGGATWYPHDNGLTVLAVADIDYSASCYVHVDVDDQYVWLGDPALQPEGTIGFLICPQIANGYGAISSPYFLGAYRAYTLGDGWYRIWFLRRFTAYDISLKRYLGFLVGAYNSTGSTQDILFDRPKLEVGSSPSEWVTGITNPPMLAGGQYGLHLDVSGVKTYDGQLWIGADGLLLSDVVPAVDGTYDLGSSDNRWATVYADSLVGDVPSHEMLDKHTESGAALDLIGFSATDTLAKLTPSADATESAILKSDSNGMLGLEGLGVGCAPTATDGDIAYSANLRPYRNSTNYTAYAVVPVAPVGSSYADQGAMTVDLQASPFSLPAGIKAVFFTLSYLAGATGKYGAIRKDSGSADALRLYTFDTTNPTRGGSLVECDASGDIYFTTDYSTSNTVVITITGYLI